MSIAQSDARWIQLCNSARRRGQSQPGRQLHRTTYGGYGGFGMPTTMPTMGGFGGFGMPMGGFGGSARLPFAPPITKKWK